jgi:hypothetical protein
MVSFHTLFEDLVDEIPASIRAESDLPFDIVGLRLSGSNVSHISKHHIYLVDDEGIADLPPDDRNIYVIYCGSLPDSTIFPRCSWQLICTQSPVNKEELADTVLAILEKYDEWQQSVMGAIVSEKPLQVIFDLCGQYIRNPLALFDNSLSLVMTTGELPEQFESEIWDEVINRGFINVEDYDPHELQFINDSISSSTKPVLYRMQTHDKTLTCMSIRLSCNGENIGVICGTSTNVPFSQGQLSLIEEARRLMELAIGQGESSFDLLTDSSHVINRLIRAEQVDEGSVTAIIRKFSWGLADEYRALFFKQSDSQPMSEMLLRQYSAQLRRLLAFSYVTGYEGGIITIVRTDGVAWSPPDKVIKFAQKQSLVIGISAATGNFMQLASACAQARAAAELGIPSPEDDICRFSEHYPRHLVDSIGPDDLDKLTYQKLALLGDDDPHKKEMLLHTLYVYLTHGRNVSASAKELYVHRNTLAYRLEKISSFIGKDVEDLSDSEATMMLMTCIILENRNQDVPGEA